MTKILIQFLINCWVTVTKKHLFNLLYFLPYKNVTIKRSLELKMCPYFQKKISCFNPNKNIWLFYN